MSWREKLYIEALHKDAKITLADIMAKRRGTFWGPTQVVLRVRKYKAAGEIRDTRVSVIKPQIHDLKLWSHLKQRFVSLKATPQMLKYMEASGGLDDYLLNTPDEQLKSDVASRLKLELLQLRADYIYQQTQGKAGNPSPSSQSSSQAASQTQQDLLAQHSRQTIEEAVLGKHPAWLTSSPTLLPIVAEAKRDADRARREAEEQKQREQAAKERRQRIERMLAASAQSQSQGMLGVQDWYAKAGLPAHAHKGSSSNNSAQT